MAYPTSKKTTAVNLRKDGFSIKEIAAKLEIAQSTSSIWLRDISLNKKAKQRLKKRKIYGQYKARLTRKKLSRQNDKKRKEKALGILNKIDFDKHTDKLLCSILFWAEGSKDLGEVSFINSDPKMIETFVTLLRSSFKLDESKFRGLIHIHEYHNNVEMKEFWSKVSGIPVLQFSKSYLKPHTKKRKRANYKGSFRVRYYNAEVAKELSAIYNMYAKTISQTGVG